MDGCLVRRGDLYTLPSGTRIPAACDGLVVHGHLVPVEHLAATLNAHGGYGKVKRRAKDATNVCASKVANDSSP